MNNHKLFCLVGKSASGKSTIEKILSSKYPRVISTTTRPIREHEQDEIDYHYVTNEEFNNKLKNYEFIEHTIYNNWGYAIEKKNIDLIKSNYIMVVEPHGLKQLQEYFGKDKVISIYVYVDDKERLLRALQREIEPDCKEICRRFLSDIELFSEIEETAIYRVNNLNANESAQIVDRIIRTETKNMIN